MIWNKIAEKGRPFIQKNKYPLLVAVLGLILLFLPLSGGEKGKEFTDKSETLSEQFDLLKLQQEMESLLEQCEGVGETQVMLTQASGMETVYEKSRDSSVRIQEADGSEQHENSEKTNLVLVRDGNYAETPVTVRTDYPILKGAVIVCRGADNSKVRLMVTEAVRSLTGLSSENIIVLKMKGE